MNVFKNEFVKISELSQLQKHNIENHVHKTNEINKKIEKQRQYASDLDKQILASYENQTGKYKMTPFEKQINIDNLLAYKTKDPKLYSAVPGWGSFIIFG